MFELFLARLSKLMERDQEVWIAGQRYVRFDQVLEASQFAEEHSDPPGSFKGPDASRAQDAPRPKRGPEIL